MSELLIETMDFDSITIEPVEIMEGLTKTKHYYISGPMLVSEEMNGNKRIYPKPVIESQVKKYQQVITEKRAVGELEHPQSSSINMDRISHVITELKMEGNVAVGKARILENMPCGSILKNLVAEGIKVGVSSRGLGTLKNGVVQNDYSMVCIDAVFNPSGPNCFMQGIVENKEWIFENGVLTEKIIEETHNQANKIVLEHQFSKEEKQSAFLKLFLDTMQKISYKYK